MQYELRTQVIEPQRKTFDHLVARYGDRPASRYEEGSFDIQARENLHYRPLWDPSKEIYDESFSVLRLTDQYSFTDPRQYYYAPYVTSRAGMSDAFGATLSYIESRGLLERLPDAWKDLPDPDSIFVGGSGREISRVVELAFARLRPGGRLVASVGSLESLSAVHQTLERATKDVSVWMINIARGTYQLERVRFEALNPTFLLGVVKSGGTKR